MEKNRVVITDVGIVNPFGNSWGEILDNLEEGKCNDIQEYGKFGIYIRKIKDSNFLTDNERKKMARFTALALETANQLDFSKNDKENISIFMGTCLGGIDFAEREIKVFYDQGVRRVSPYLAISMFYSSNVAQIAIFNDIHGQLLLFSDGATAGGSAICWAYEYIKNHLASTTIAGGSESQTTELVIKAFADMEMFENGNGIICEGCGLLLMENEESARSLNKKIWGEIIGYEEGQSSRITDVKENILISIINCFEKSNVSAKEIDAVVLNNDNIFENSKHEFQAMKELFLNTETIFLSMKHLMGYSFGAGLAQEIVLMLACMARGRMPESFILKDTILSSGKKGLNMQKDVLNILFVNIDIYGRCISLIVRREKT